MAQPLACAYKSRVSAGDLAAAMNSSGDLDEPPSPVQVDEDASDSAEDVVRAVSRTTSAASALDDDDDEAEATAVSDGSDSPVHASSKGVASAKPTIHWKNGYTLDARGERKDLTSDELDRMRRERNRLHAKMTRDRKKVYIETLSRAVSDLEEENRRVRSALAIQLNATVGEPQRYLDTLVDDDGGEIMEPNPLVPC